MIFSITFVLAINIVFIAFKKISIYMYEVEFDTTFIKD